MSKKSSAPGFACYASVLGECNGTMSREHYVTEGGLELIRAALPGSPRVYKKGNLRPLEIGKLAERILCKKHNSDLSDFDQAFINIMRSAEAMYDADKSGDPSAETFTINGDHLERGMLKTLIGCLYSGKLWDDLDSMQGKTPPLEWLEVLYRGRAFPMGQGLYWQSTEMEGLSLDGRDQLEVLPWLSAHPPDDQFVIGLHAWFFSFHLALLAANAKPGSVEGHYRPAGLRVHGCNKRIAFNWSGGPRYPEIVLQR
jgi:hypothetical protein